MSDPIRLTKFKIRTKANGEVSLGDLESRELVFEQSTGKLCFKDADGNLIHFIPYTDDSTNDNKTWSSEKILDSINQYSLPDTINFNNRTIRLKTKTEESDVESGDVHEQEIIIGAYQKALFIKVNGNLLVAPTIDDDAETVTQTWSAYKIAYEILNRSPVGHKHTPSDITGLAEYIEEIVSDYTAVAPIQIEDSQISITRATSSTDGYLSSSDYVAFDGKQEPLGYTPENTANKGIANGYCELDSGARVPSSRLPAAAQTSCPYFFNKLGATVDDMVLFAQNGILAPYTISDSCEILSMAVYCVTPPSNATNNAQAQFIVRRNGVNTVAILTLDDSENKVAASIASGTTFSAEDELDVVINLVNCDVNPADVNLVVSVAF